MFFARARLLLDGIELSGWHLGKKETRHVPLNRLGKVEWDPTGSPNAVFHLTEGEQIQVTLSHIDRWQKALEDCLRWSTFGHPLVSTTRASRDWTLQDLITYTTSMG